jgi:hypothetical protein
MSEQIHPLLGRTFCSAEEVQEGVKLYEKNVYHKFYKLEARTIVNARKRGVKRFVKPDLYYYDLTYWCIKGGKKYESKATIRKSGGYVPSNRELSPRYR